MRYIATALICLFLSSTPVFADAPNEVRELLKTKIDAVLVLLRDSAMDKAVDKGRRDAWITDLIKPIFAYPTMAKLSLGKKHWGTLTPQQRNEFSDLFTRRLQESYLDKLDIFTDETVSYGEPVSDGNKVTIPTTLVSNGDRIEMIYKFYRAKTGWKIYDVEIEGVSVIQSYRAQFSEALTQGSIDDLLEKLRTDGAFKLPDSESNGDRPGAS